MKGPSQIEYHDISMKTKLFLNSFRWNFWNVDGKSFFTTLLCFTPYWDYKPTNRFHAVSPGVNTCDKYLNLSTINKIHLKTNVIDGSIVIKLREPILFLVLF